MPKTLTKKEIKALIRNENMRSSNGHLDEIDSILDILLNMYEKKEINEEILRAFISMVISNMAKEAIGNLRQDFAKSYLNIHGSTDSDSKKLFLLNYSKKVYA